MKRIKQIIKKLYGFTIMKTRRFIYGFRAVSEIIILLLLVVIALLEIIDPRQALQEMFLSMWPLGAGLMFAYAVLTCIEDYLNNRIFHHCPKLI